MKAAAMVNAQSVLWLFRFFDSLRLRNNNECKAKPYANRAATVKER